ncbi:MAG: hypothetical protein A3B44_01175 [Candidatus Levybacteria bacterium RIFCSPLOWO2_01_FULL_38_21]|nr:MAG: hypothetical protein A3B44_01175 [Candidatus Levybacteria bacterium RIFCSPLOWO2_01_FULL_38_21]
MKLIKSRSFFIILLILSFLGFLDSTYLTILHYKNAFPPCSVTSGCEEVLTSPYSVLGPMPLALYGSVFYLAVIVLSLILITNYKKLYLNILYPLVFVGFIVSVILFLIQAFILHSFCQYCVISEIIATALLILAVLRIWEGKKN